MKKFALVAAVALMGTIVLPSCKKDYTCTCDVLGEKMPTTLKNVSKKDAKAACDAMNISGISCTLD